MAQIGYYRSYHYLENWGKKVILYLFGNINGQLLYTFCMNKAEVYHVTIL